MSKYVKYYNARQGAYRTLATMFTNMRDSGELSVTETVAASVFLAKVAKRFGLVSEFKAAGVIV